MPVFDLLCLTAAPSCAWILLLPGSLQDIEPHFAPFNGMTNSQRLLMYINGIFGLLLLGMVVPFLIVSMAAEKHHDTILVPGEYQ
jgi:hypothetical protein